MEASESSNTGLRRAGAARRFGAALDETDFRILEVLRDDGRIAIAALADIVSVSRANAYARLERLRSAGVITGFSAQVDPTVAGLPVCALVFVTVHPQSWDRFHAGIQQLPDVEYCCITSGEHDAMLQIRAHHVAGVHDFVTGVLAPRQEIKAIVSVVVLDEVVRRPYVLPTDVRDRPSASARLGLTRFTRAENGRDSVG